MLARSQEDQALQSWVRDLSYTQAFRLLRADIAKGLWFCGFYFDRSYCGQLAPLLCLRPHKCSKAALLTQCCYSEPPNLCTASRISQALILGIVLCCA